MIEHTMNNRIAHIQKYANDRGFALALAPRSKGLHTIGFAKAGSYTQRLILDQAIATIDECSNDRVYLNRRIDAQQILPFDL